VRVASRDRFSGQWSVVKMNALRVAQSITFQIVFLPSSWFRDSRKTG